MSARRVVEYLVVAGIVEREDSEATANSGPSHVGDVLQSFPSNGRPSVALPAGIELFCQPQGWEIVTKPHSPYFVPFVLTSETGTRLYCVSLNFYQTRRPPSVETDELDHDVATSSSSLPYHRKLTATTSGFSTTSMGGEDLDLQWDVDMIDGGTTSPKVEFKPVSLCAISLQPLFCVLKYCLCGLYASWISGEHVLEDVVVKMLCEIKLPLSGTLTMSLGSLTELTLPSFDERTALPLTTTECIVLLKSIGVHNVVNLLSAILMDESVLFISSSYSSLTGAVRALVSLVYPFVLPYSLVPIVPRDILEYVQLPSTYIMGVPSQYSDELPEPLDVIQVFLDDGRLDIPQSTEILPLPYSIHQHLETALNRIIDPCYEYRDSAFPPNINQQLPSVEYQDKQVRATFLCTILSLVGDYYNHITVLKLCPEPAIAFNKKAFIAARKEDEDTVFTKMADSLAFRNFVQLKAIPYRICDYADDLMAELATEDRIDLDVLYSPESLNRITNRIAKLLLCDKLQSKNDITSLYNTSSDLLNSKGTKKRFPSLDTAQINTLCKQLSPDDDDEDISDLYQFVPIIDKLKESHHKTMKRYSNAVSNEIGLLKKCLDALFQSKIYEARKYIPLITQSFKNDAVARLFVPELVQRLTTYGGFLSTEQFDILVKLLNSAMIHESMAAWLLPLSTAFYRELCPGTTQQAYSCMQNHLMWESKQFWRDTMYKAIQTELVRIHTTEEEGNEYINQADHSRRRLTQLNEECELDNKEYYEAEPPNGKPVLRTKSDTTYDTPPIRQRAQLQHSSSQHRLRVTHRMAMLTRSVKMRIRASTVMPGAAEGVAPPDAKPVTIHETLEVLGMQQKSWNNLPSDQQDEKVKQEENSIINQVVLFVSRVIWLRCPLEFPEDDPFWKTFTKELTDFLNELLRSVEVDIRLDAQSFSKIRGMIGELIALHIATLDNQRRNLKKLPNGRMKVIKPPMLEGEKILADCVRTFLLPDGRDDNILLPAEGYFFVTSYRLIFLGTPCDPSLPNALVTRTMPVTAVYQLKKIGAQALPSHGISIVEGLQLRSLTGQLIKIGFDDETVPNAKKLHQDIITKSHPKRIELALSAATDIAEGDGIDTTGQLKRFLSDTRKFNSLLMQPSPTVRRKQRSILRKSRVVRQGQSIKKSSSFTNENDALSLQSVLQVLSHTPVCLEYERMKVGDIKQEQDKSDHGIWRLSTVNAHYGVCNSYPAVVAVPSSVSDDLVISLANQFKENRFPVVTWRHPESKAVILRSSTFSESAPLSNAVSYHKGHRNETEEAIQEIPNGPVPTRGARQSAYVHMGGSGIYHASLSRLLYGVVMCIKSLSSNECACSLSNNELFSSAGEFQEYITIDDNPPTPPQRTKRKVTITKSNDKLQNQLKDNLDFERGGFCTDEPDGPTFSRQTAHASPDPLGLDRPPKKLPMKSESSCGIDIKSPTHFSSLPTSPRDWVMVEALPRQMTHWKTSPVYIIADKNVLRKVPPTLYPNCTFLPVEGKHHKEIHFSFRKLMRACSPSSPGAGAFLGAVEDSEWLNQLSNLLQLAGAVVDLIDLQCSSVLVALENGWDYTAQVVSLAQLLLDPYYRTISGFRKLIEKDWMAFGHPFSLRNNLTIKSTSQDVSPVFLQFLDCVHQVLVQFPVAFEFNDYYLRMMAYHSCSMRFHTFALNSDKERGERGWQDYHVTWTRSKNVRVEDFNSFWTFVDNISKESMMFYNFNYSSDLSKDATVLRPHSFVANLDIWSYYLENQISQFTPYDPEFICHRNLTLSDIHHKFFHAPKTWESLVPADSQFMPVVRLTHQCVDVANEIHVINNLPLVMWKELLQDLESKIYKNRTSSTQDEADTPLLSLAPLKSPITSKHNKVLHNKTSMAVLIKGRLSVEAERNFIHPHNFVQVEVVKKKECNFCKHRLYQKTAIQCTACNGWYHHYCKNLVPYNCGVTDFLQPIAEEVKPDLEPSVRKRTGSSLFYIDRNPTTYEGYLYKKGKMVKSWRLRWFVLDLESKMLSYYDGKGDAKSKGIIDMSEVMTIQELKNQTAYPSPALKAGEKGYYFQLVTQKRTYQLMSVQDAARHEWMSKLKQCASIS